MRYFGDGRASLVAMPRPRPQLVPAVLVAALAAASPAAAASGTIELPRGPGPASADPALTEVVGPRPAGELVVLATGSATHGWSVRTAAPGAPPREIARVPAAPESTLDVLASASHVALLRHAAPCPSRACRDTPPTTLSAVLAGPLSGPIGALSQCGAPGAAACASACPSGARRVVAGLGGDRLAFQGPCAPGVVLRDLVGGAERTIGPHASGIAILGGRIAIAQAMAFQPGEPPALGDRVVVRDLATGAELYRTTERALGLQPPLPLALLEDGSVAYTTVRPGPSLALVVAGPGDPHGRVVAPLGFATLAGAGARHVLIDRRSPTRSGELELVRVDGGASTTARIHVGDITGDSGFDGTTITWAQRRCTTTFVTRWRLDEPRPSSPDLRCGTPLPVRRTATLSRARVLRVALRCPATGGRGGCLSTVALTAIERGRPARGVNAAQRLRALGRQAVALDPGERATVRVVVPAVAARWVRRRSPLRLRIEVRSERGAPAIVRRTVPLRAAR